MRSLRDLHLDELEVALKSADALMSFKKYLPPGGLLVMLLGRWRDDIRGVLRMEAEDIPHRGNERKPLDELTSVELDTVSGAVGILLQDRFQTRMCDPELPKQLREFDGSLTQQKTERAQLRASWAS
jgi:hypothetical protein